MFTEEGTWYLLVHTTCKHLQSDNRCGIYDTRPQVCRDYTTDNCEYEDDWVYDHYFETSEQVGEYMRSRAGADRWGHSQPQAGVAADLVNVSCLMTQCLKNDEIRMTNGVPLAFRHSYDIL